MYHGPLTLKLMLCLYVKVFVLKLVLCLYVKVFVEVSLKGTTNDESVVLKCCCFSIGIPHFHIGYLALQDSHGPLTLNILQSLHVKLLLL